MIYVRNKQDALKLWPYPVSKPTKGDIPEKYPCIMEYSGTYYGYVLRTIDIPKNIQSPMQLECFIAGIHAPIKESDCI